MKPHFDLDHPLPPPTVLPPTPDALLSDIETFLQTLLADLVPQDPSPSGPGRPRVLPSLLLWTALLLCVLHRATSRLAIWRLLTSRGMWHYPRVAVTDQAVYKRLDAAGTQPLRDLLSHVSALLCQRLAPYADKTLAPFATSVVAIDETTLDPVARILPTLRPLARGDSTLLPGKLSSIFDLRLQQWLHIEHQDNPHQNEKVAARGLLAHIPKGSLILADLGYFSFAWFDDLTSAGYWWVSRLRSKTSWTKVHTYYEDATTFDGVIWLGAYRADRTARAVRLVQFRVGTRSYQYLTNVLDPRTLPLHEIARLYVRRWDIELGFKLVKQHLGLHVLWTGKPVVVLQQVWAVLILAQILQALRMEIAGRAGVDPYEVSMALLVEYLPKFVARGLDGVAEFVAQGRDLRFIRPSTRTKVQAPVLDIGLYAPLPPDVVLTRTPRYAERKCGSRKKPPN
jgi:hypothetical protein